MEILVGVRLINMSHLRRIEFWGTCSAHYMLLVSYSFQSLYHFPRAVTCAFLTCEAGIEENRGVLNSWPLVTPVRIWAPLRLLWPIGVPECSVEVLVEVYLHVPESHVEEFIGFESANKTP